MYWAVGPPIKSEEVAPFGNLRVEACCQLTEAYRVTTTSFIGQENLGIHQMH